MRAAAERALQLPRYAATEQAARKELAELEPRIARLTLRLEALPSGTEVFLQGTRLPRTSLGVPVPVMPGPVSLVVQAPGHERIERQLTLSAGESHEEALALVASAPPPPTPTPTPVPAPSPRAWERRAAWIATGASGAGLASFGVFALLADKRFDSLAKQCGSSPCPAELQPSVKGGRRFQTVANVSLGVGLISAAAAGVFFGLGASRSELTAVPTTQGVAVQGRF